MIEKILKELSESFDFAYNKSDYRYDDIVNAERFEAAMKELTEYLNKE
jgi:hypothetical protein